MITVRTVPVIVWTADWATATATADPLPETDKPRMTNTAVEITDGRPCNERLDRTRNVPTTPPSLELPLVLLVIYRHEKRGTVREVVKVPTPAPFRGRRPGDSAGGASTPSVNVRTQRLGAGNVWHHPHSSARHVCPCWSISVGIPADFHRACPAVSTIGHSSTSSPFLRGREKHQVAGAVITPSCSLRTLRSASGPVRRNVLNSARPYQSRGALNRRAQHFLIRYVDDVEEDVMAHGDYERLTPQAIDRCACGCGLDVLGSRRAGAGAVHRHSARLSAALWRGQGLPRRRGAMPAPGRPDHC